MNYAYLEAKRQLAFDPPTHMSPGEWRKLVEGLVRQIEQDRVNVLYALEFQLGERIALMNNQDQRVSGLLDAIDMLHALTEVPHGTVQSDS